MNVTGLSSAVFNGPTFNVAQILDGKTFRFQLSGASLPLETPPGPANVYLFIKLKVGGVETETVRKLSWPVAKVTGVTGHGAALFDVVEISSSNVSYLNGRFVVVGVETDAVWVHLTTTGSGTATSSVNSSCTCARVRFRFDEVMRGSLTGSMIHLGPGTFDTRGSCLLFFKESVNFSFEVGWLAKSGQKIRGCGMGVTTLKLAYAMEPDFTNVVVANYTFIAAPNNNLQHFELSDLTVDCDLGSQPVPANTGLAPVVCGAINLFGDFTRIRRVRVINWGDQSKSECFVMFISGAYRVPANGPIYNRIEECVVEKPGLNNTHENTLIALAGDAVSANGRSLIARNNFINGELGPGISSQPVAVASITEVSSNPIHVKITTKKPHNRSVGQAVIILGLKSGGSGFNISHSEYLIVLSPPPGYTANDIYARWLPGLPSVSTLDVSAASVGTDFHPVTALSGTGCVTEGNTVFDCINAFYVDTGNTRDAVVRYNYFSGVDKGVYFNFNGGGLPSGGEEFRKDVSATIVLPGGSNTSVARFTSSTAHLLKTGDLVQVANVRVNGQIAPADTYNGVFYISNVIASNQFEYAMRSNASQNADAATSLIPIQYRALWQVRRLFYYCNHLDLNPFDDGSWSTPFGVGDVVGTIQEPAIGSPPFVFPACQFIENSIRVRDGLPVPDRTGNLGTGFVLTSFENSLIEGNLVDVPNPIALQEVDSRATHGFNNRALGGRLLPLNIGSTGVSTTASVESTVADALALSLLGVALEAS